MQHLLWSAAATLLILSFFKGHSLPCVWDLNKSQSQFEEENCGFLCKSPWERPDPYYCGGLEPCCCAPTCDSEAAANSSVLGINWNDSYMKRPLPRTQQFQILKDSGFHHIKIFTPSGIRDIHAVYGNDVHIYVGIPNRYLTRLASDLDYARRLVRERLYEFRAIIDMVIMGNEALICIRSENWIRDRECGALNAPTKLLPAMKTMYLALELEGMSRRVTTAFNGGIMEMSQDPWTPCVADYKEFLKPLLKPIWDFLRQTGSPFIVNLYSWFAAKEGYIPTKVACGVPAHILPFDGKHNYYFNFDSQLDMNRIAMCKNNIQDLELWIGETGWPTHGHVKATTTNGYWYTNNVIRRSQGLGLNDEQEDNFRFRGLPFTVFLFEAFDEERKFEIEHGNKFENAFGLFYEDGTPKWREANRMAINLPIPGQYIKKIKI